MIVGTKVVSIRELKVSCNSIASLVRFAEDLVPKPLRHIEAIVNNQKFLVATVLRDIKSIPYKRRIELCEGLLQGVSVRGIANAIFDMEDVMSEVDTDKLYKYLFKEESSNGS